MASKKSIKKNKKLSINDNGYFKVSLDTFLYNAGIVGFIQVLEEALDNKKNEKYFYYKGQDLYVSKQFIKEIDLGRIFIKTVCDKFEKETFIYQLKDENTKDPVLIIFSMQ